MIRYALARKRAGIKSKVKAHEVAMILDDVEGMRIAGFIDTGHSKEDDEL